MKTRRAGASLLQDHLCLGVPASSWDCQSLTLAPVLGVWWYLLLVLISIS